MDYEDGEKMAGEQASYDEGKLNASGEGDGSSIASPTYSGPASPVDRQNSPARGNPRSPDNMSPDGPCSPDGPASPDNLADDSGNLQEPGDIGSPESPRSPASANGSAPCSPMSPSGSGASKNASPAGSHVSRSRSASPNENTRGQSHSNSPANRRHHSHSWSATPPDGRSRSASPSGSHNASPGGSRSRSGSPARSGSPHGSQNGSRQGSRSRSVSPGGSRSRSRSGSPVARSRSHSGSPAPSHSRSPVRSHSGSPIRSRSGSPAARSRSGSPARSHSASPVRSHSRSRSRSHSAARSRSRSRSAPRSPTRDDDDEEVIGRRKHRDDSDNEGSDKGSEVGELIADIFGSSDEEEFEGFGNTEAEVPQKKDKKKSGVSEDDAGDAASVLPDVSDDEADTGKRHAGEFLSDFDLMLEKKKEEMRKKRRRRKDVDIINDNDDLIDALIGRMKMAAEEDRTLNQQRKPAVKKLGMLPKVVSQLKKADLQNAFIDGGILNVMTEWLAPLPDKSLPHLQIREALLKQLLDFPTISNEGLKTSGIGKAVMYLYKHPKEIRQNKDIAQKLINEWSRPIFNLTSDLKQLSREEREQRDYEHLPKKRRISLETGATPRRDIDKALTGSEKVLRPGDPGYICRARVPQPSNKDYVIRPKWNVEEKPKGAGKKQASKYEMHVRAQKRKMATMKQQRAVPMSIEGRNMSL